ncbi:MAG: hypothetical protein JSR21_08865 [Proteobacteria bacterium]|nr:hypothetical protein [Pseudomonadota bacterium]
MDYSTAFIVRAAQAAQDERRADDWARLPIGERVLLIYRQMQRLDAAAPRGVARAA